MLVRVLDIAILGLLMDRDHHGYEIRSQLRDRLGVWANVSFGAIYPALARLERQGLVEAVQSTEPRSSLGTLSTGSLSGERASLRARRASTGLGRRGRKVYRITGRGRDEFKAMLANPATVDDSKNFSLRMALGRHLTPSLRVILLERRRADLLERLAEVRAGAHNEDLDTYARDVMEHAAQGVELDLAWIDAKLSTERSDQQTLARQAK
jgi:DNA-binding PadR family transcriptional regulator